MPISVLLVLGGCKAELEGPTPTVSGVAPGAVCNAQITTSVKISGDQFSPLPVRALTDDPALALPDVALARATDLEGAIASAEPILISGRPRNEEDSRLTWESKQAIRVRIDEELALADGLYDVMVTNANAESAAFAQSLLAVPPPSLEAISTDLLCADKDNELGLDGGMLVRFGDLVPELAFADAASLTASSMDGCRMLPGDSGAEACTSMDVDVPAALLATGGEPYAHFGLAVRNPESVQCTSVEEHLLTTVPRPVLATLEPMLMCVAQGEIPLLLSGSAFLTIDGATPALQVGTQTFSTKAVDSSCVDIPGPAAVVKSCTELTAGIPQDGLEVGVHAVTVLNPAPADCASSDPVELQVVPPPSITEAQPDVACVADGARSIRIIGSDFLVLGATSGTPELPTVTIDDTAYVPTFSQDDCSSLAGPVVDALVCMALTITVPDTVAAKSYTVAVTNPAPADCTVVAAALLHVMPPPGLSAIEPSAVCLVDGDVQLAVSGSGLLVIDDQVPTLLLALGSTVEHALQPELADMDGCTSYAGATETVSACTSFVVTLPGDTTAFAELVYDAWVENPAPAGCASPHATLARFPEATITGVPVAELCTGGGAVVVEGSGISAAAQVYVDTIPAGSVVLAGDGSRATAVFSALPPGTFDVRFANAPGCSDVIAAGVTVGAGPTAFFADPPVVFNGISTQITVYVADLTKPVVTAELVPEAGGDPVSLIAVDTTNTDPSKVVAGVPALTPPGIYGLTLTGSGGGGCATARLIGAVEVVAETTLDILSVSPGFGGTAKPTAVTIETDPSAGGGLLPIPRVYLNPSAPGGTALAVEAVTYLDTGTLTAQMPPGLAPDAYDIIIVNPDGSVAVSDVDESTGIDERFHVMADPPPVIDSIAPGFVAAKPSCPITVTGSDFTVPSPEDPLIPEVTLECRNEAGTVTDVTLTKTASDAISFTGTFDCSALSNNFCIVRLANADGSFGEFSSLVISGNDQKLSAFSYGPDLKFSRRGLTGAAGRVTSAARYVYAIGGDDGTDAGVFDSVEASAVDIRGNLYGFHVLRARMLTPRALHGTVTVGRFIYAIGGTDGVNVLGSVERAYVLSPEERPRITSVSLELNETEGLTQGTWYYKVSAAMAADDPFNPGGETLPSEAFVMRLPDLGDYKARVVLNWEAAPGNVVGYRVYRSPATGTAAGDEQLAIELGDVLTATDNGAATQAEAPLGVGALGVWHPVIDPATSDAMALTTPRKGAAVAAAISPDGSYFNIYVMVGRNDTGLLRSYEHCRIDVDPATGSQMVAHGFAVAVPAGSAPPAARWQAGAFVATPQNSPNVGTATYLYLGGGASTSSNPVDDLDYGVVDWSDEGHLEDNVGNPGLVSLGGSATMNQQYGYGALVANNYLYAIGGKQSIDTSNTCYQTFICDGAGLGCPVGVVAPAVDNWTNTMESMLVPRRLMGLAVESAFIYLLGGDSVGGPTATTEMTIW